MKVLAIIPARYASTRFPGKPLAMLGGKTMIQRVYEQVSKVPGIDVVIATDDERIANVARAFGANVVMTSAQLQSGTDRCIEAYVTLSKDYDILINVQGDEPFIEPAQIEQLVHVFAQQASCDIATLMVKLHDKAQADNPNVVKVVFAGQSGKALYFSRALIPYVRDAAQAAMVQYYQHVGVYAFRTKVLPVIQQMQTGILEQAESLEQLRWLEHGLSIYVSETDKHAFGIDTPADLERAARLLD